MHTKFLLVTFYLIGDLPATEGLRVMPSSAQSQGMIGGKIALGSDPSVLRLNPASMTDLEGFQFQSTASLLFGQTDYDRGNGDTSRLDRSALFSGSANAVWNPTNSPFAFGFGINAPFGLAAKWTRNGAFQFQAPYDEELIFLAFNPAIAWQVNDRLSIGAGLEVAYSELSIKQDFPWAAVPGAGLVPNGALDFDGSGWGIGGYLGLNWEIREGHRLSIVGRLPITIDYDGDFSVSNIPEVFTPVFSPQSDFSSDITYPGSIAIAYRWELSESLRLGFEYEWIQNSSHDDVPLGLGTNQGLLPSDRLNLDWNDTFSAGFGVEWDASEKLTLRAGYLYSENPADDATFTPAIPGNDRHMLSIGATYDFTDDLSMSVAYVAGFYPDREVRGNENPAFNGDYDIHWDVLTTSLTYRW